MTQNYKDFDIELFAIHWLDFRPYYYQGRFLNACLTNNKVLGIWARQSGKSQTVSVYALFRAIMDSVQIIIVAPTQSQSGELY